MVFTHVGVDWDFDINTMFRRFLEQSNTMSVPGVMQLMEATSRRIALLEKYCGINYGHPGKLTNNSF